MWASDNGHVEVVEELLRHGARADSQDKVLYNHLCAILCYYSLSIRMGGIH